MYNALREDFKKVSLRKMICNNPAPPKYSFGTWLTIHARLPTCDGLNKVGIYCDQLCFLCKKKDDTHSHLLFKCEYSEAVRIGILHWSTVSINNRNW
jgi:hypothetical protein